MEKPLQDEGLLGSAENIVQSQRTTMQQRRQQDKTERRRQDYHMDAQRVGKTYTTPATNNPCGDCSHPMRIGRPPVHSAKALIICGPMSFRRLMVSRDL